MKYILTVFALFMLAGCGESSGAAKSDPPKMNLSESLPVLSGENIWIMDPAKSTLEFVATHNSRDFTGGFSHFVSVIKLDPASPAGGEIHAVIDLSSVDAGDRDRNANLPGKDWFHITNFPTALFSSQDITALGGDNFKAKGTLKLKGVSKPVTLTFSLQVNGNQAVAIGGADILRTDFNVGEGPDFTGEDWVKFPVAVKFNIVAEK